MSRFKHTLVLSLLLLGCKGFVAAQVFLNVIHSDTVQLQAAPYQGTLQWQVSSDSIAWNDIVGADYSPYSVAVNSMPSYFRALILEPGCDPYYSEVASVRSDPPSYYWSDPNAWDDGTVPVENEQVLIPDGRRIILDVSPPQLDGLMIEGTLEFLEADLELTTDWIVVQGLLQVGTEQEPFQHQAVFMLTGSDTAQSIMGMGTRGIIVMNGALELHGTPPDVVWTKINAHASASSTSLELMESVNWQADDEIVVGPTDYYEAGNGTSVSQRISLTGVSGSSVQLAQGLNAFRWGLLQYATESGMSLTPTNLLTPPVPDTQTETTPLVLDERAPVGHLTRNIVIQAPDDALWQDQGFGVHSMIMPNATAHVEGVEFRRAGQRARIRRYPFHWHILSYSGSQTLADATGQYLRNSTINSSRNRGVVIHGTNGVEVSRNVLFDIEGHGIFTEDAAERRNLIDSNLVLHIRNPQVDPQNALKQHEVAFRGSSGFWISNPDNVITNNHAADCGTNGFWLAFPEHPWGNHQNVLDSTGGILNPSRTRFGVFDGNTAHSNGLEGIMLDNVEVDNQGNTYPFGYISTSDGLEPVWPGDNQRRFSLSRYSVWKNQGNGIWDRANWPDNFEVVSADNCGRFFAGAGFEGVIERSLVIGTSLNHLMNGTDRPAEADYVSGYSSSTPAAFATYHSTFSMRNNIVVGFEGVPETRSGAFSMEDYYIRPVDKGQSRNTNNLLVNSHPGIKLYALQDHFTLASALWDPYGVWGPAGNYLVYDIPFLTYGKTTTIVPPSTTVSGGVSVEGPFYGFEGFSLHGLGSTPPYNEQWADLMAIHIRRLDENMNEVASWTVEEALPTDLLSQMRDFATTPEGIYELTFPQEDSVPTNFYANVENMMTTDDVQVIGVQFNGNLNPEVAMQSPGNYVVYQEVSSLQDVINSAGETFWQDSANDMVWVKLRGGTWAYWTNDPNLGVPSYDELLYETTTLRIFEP